jgi:subtilisin family serine protease
MPAPAAPDPTPAPTTPAPAEPAAPPAAIEPDEALTEPTDRWWLLDEGVSRYPGTSADLAYRELLANRGPARTVVVAIIDSGTDIEHEDLDGNVWMNDDEVAGNGRDDDGNGYVDDVHGWNFIGGAGGEHVEKDTYELTRLYARLRRYEGADPDTLSAVAATEYEQFVDVAAEFGTERAEAVAQVREIEEFVTAFGRIIALLENVAGSDSLTVEQVRAIRSFQPDVLQAKDIYLNLHAQDVTPELVDEQLEYVQSRVEYGFNPDFDPRHIVGDDYDDPTERYYGNALVEGPAADHGTHVAGIVAAERDNATGVDGIAAAAELMILRAVPDGDERDKDVANAIRYAVDNGADIINMSFGKAHSPQKEVVDAAVRYADEAGVLMIHAAGNDAADIGQENNFPSRHYLEGGMAENWIEVGASSWQAPDNLAATFSNYNRERVDVFAPGADILSTIPDDEYETNSGTSMAAPVVSGLAALIMAYYPGLTATQVKRVILDSAIRYPDRAVVLPGSESDTILFSELSATGGIVNAYAALRMAEEMSGR